MNRFGEIETMKYKILIVDDEPANLRMLERLFRADHVVITASSGPEALELLNHHGVELIISDQRMPGMTGIEFLKQAAQMRPQTVRIILTGYTDVNDLVEAINSGVIYRYITKPWVNSDLQHVVHRGIEHYEATRTQHLYKLENDRLKTRIRKTVQSFVNATAELTAKKGTNTADHCRRTSNYAARIGHQFDLEPREIEHLIFASLLHEVPHHKIPFEIDLDKTALTSEQYCVIRDSYENGISLISSVPDLEEVATIIRFQHEHYDGTGCFDGLDGEKIPFNSRILAVANAYDEITSGQNPGLLCTDQEAADLLRSRAGAEFDARIVEACLGTELEGQSGIEYPRDLIERGFDITAFSV
jgi:response regulator RpfG family c-di-GMP phosphodiesterase